jgi:putative transposase
MWMPGAGFDRNLNTPQAIRASIDYLHANPVRRGLSDNNVDYWWSSARAYAGLEDCSFKVDLCPMIL